MSKRKHPTPEQRIPLVVLNNRVPLKQLQIVYEVDFNLIKSYNSLKYSLQYLQQKGGFKGKESRPAEVKPSPDLLKFVEYYYPHVPTPLIAEKSKIGLDIIYTIAVENGINKLDTAVTCQGLTDSQFADSVSRQRYLELKGM